MPRPKGTFGTKHKDRQVGGRTYEEKHAAYLRKLERDAKKPATLPSSRERQQRQYDAKEVDYSLIPQSILREWLSINEKTHGGLRARALRWNFGSTQALTGFLRGHKKATGKQLMAVQIDTEIPMMRLQSEWERVRMETIHDDV